MKKCMGYRCYHWSHAQVLRRCWDTIAAAINTIKGHHKSKDDEVKQIWIEAPHSSTEKVWPLHLRHWSHGSESGILEFTQGWFLLKVKEFPLGEKTNENLEPLSHHVCSHVHVGLFGHQKLLPRLFVPGQMSLKLGSPWLPGSGVVSGQAVSVDAAGPWELTVPIGWRRMTKLFTWTWKSGNSLFDLPPWSANRKISQLDLAQPPWYPDSVAPIWMQNPQVHSTEQEELPPQGSPAPVWQLLMLLE